MPTYRSKTSTQGHNMADWRYSTATWLSAVVLSKRQA